MIASAGGTHHHELHDRRQHRSAPGAELLTGANLGSIGQLDPAGAPPVAGDTRAPRLSVAGVGRRVRRKALRAGLTARVGADEPVAVEIELLVAPRRVTLARTPDLALVRLSRPRQAGTRTVRLKPRRRLSGTRPIPAQLRIVAYDGSGNRTAKTIRFTIR
jgi:hypothetical protein